jgi:hypothetical protein
MHLRKLTSLALPVLALGLSACAPARYSDYDDRYPASRYGYYSPYGYPGYSYNYGADHRYRGYYRDRDERDWWERRRRRQLEREEQELAEERARLARQRRQLREQRQDAAQQRREAQRDERREQRQERLENKRIAPERQPAPNAGRSSSTARSTGRASQQSGD